MKDSHTQALLILLQDALKAEINRMCTTIDLSEFDKAYGKAKTNLEKLSKLVYESKFKFSNDPNTTYYDRINEFIREGHHVKA